MNYQLIDGNNLIHRYIHTHAYPLLRFVELVRSSTCPIIVWDGANGLKKRRALYPEYKVQRDRSKSSVTHEVMDVARELADNLNCIQVRLDDAEADDVIAHMVTTLGKDNVSFIYSNDIDLAGFGIPTLYKKDVPDHLKLYKTLVGKSSDNVKGLRLFGPKAWEKLSDAQKWRIIAMLTDQTIIADTGELDEKLEKKLTADLPNLKTLWQISNFLPITKEELDAGTTLGKSDENTIEMIRQELMLWPT